MPASPILVCIHTQPGTWHATSGIKQAYLVSDHLFCSCASSPPHQSTTTTTATATSADTSTSMSSRPRSPQSVAWPAPVHGFAIAETFTILMHKLHDCDYQSPRRAGGAGSRHTCLGMCSFHSSPAVQGAHGSPTCWSYTNSLPCHAPMCPMSWGGTFFGAHSL